MGNVFELKRHLFTELSSGGDLFEPDGTRVCSVLEDTDRGIIQGDLPSYGKKIFGKTAIPYGFYEIRYNYSPHFDRRMPYILNVPTHDGVMFHWGNTPENTEGCPLVGQKLGHDFIGQSKLAFDDLEKVFAKYFAENERIYLQITKNGEVQK